MSDQVFISFSEAELKEAGEKLAAVIVALDELAEEKKVANEDFKARKEALSKQAHKLSASIRHKGEYREAQAPLFSLPVREGGRRQKDNA